MNEDEELRSAITKIFGKEAYTNNILDSKYISSIVFSDPAKLKSLNSMVHPATKKDGGSMDATANNPYAIHEAALIFEAKVSDRLDYVIGVSSPEELRIKRAMARDNVSREEVLKRMNKQLDEEIKMSKCDFILVNDEQQLLIPQVLELHEKLIDLSNKKRMDNFPNWVDHILAFIILHWHSSSMRYAKRKGFSGIHLSSEQKKRIYISGAFHFLLWVRQSC